MLQNQEDWSTFTYVDCISMQIAYQTVKLRICCFYSSQLFFTVVCEQLYCEQLYSKTVLFQSQEGTHHNLSQTQYNDCRGLCTGYGIEELQQGSTIKHKIDTRLRIIIFYLTRLTLVSVMRRPRTDVMTMIPTKINDTCWDQNSTCIHTQSTVQCVGHIHYIHVHTQYTTQCACSTVCETHVCSDTYMHTTHVHTHYVCIEHQP